jgi:hypothetical protein
MIPRRTSASGVLVVLVVLGALVVGLSGGVAAQSDESSSPEWADETFERLGDAVEEYNARGGDPGVIEGWLLRNARVNLHVSDDEGARAVYSLRLDDEARVTALERGRFEDPTLRVTTTKRTVDGIDTSDDVEAEVRRGVQSGRIRVERVFELLPGLRIGVGVEEVLVGVGGVLAASVAVAKVGLDTTLSFLRGLIRRLVVLLRDLWASFRGIGLGGLATLLTVLEKLGLLEPLQRLVGRVRRAIRNAFDAVLGPREPPANRNEPDEGKQ